MQDNKNTAPVDLSYLAEYTNGDQDAIRELIEVFYETADEALGDLKSNITEGENAAWAAAGHKLKGAAGYVGAESLKDLCAQAQNMKEATLPERETLFRQIKEMYGHVHTYLEGEQK